MSTPAEVKKSADQKMQKGIESFRANLAKIRTGRPHPGVLDHIHVDYYGTSTPISQVANISLADARTLSVTVWEKSMATVVEKAIRDSDLGVNPQSMGTVIRVPMPPLSEERRRDIVKVTKHEGESAKVLVRGIRREANDELKALAKGKQISEDDERRGQDEVQKLTDRYIAEIDKLLAAKEQEIMTV
ncbi:MAG: ribosome recycling factor [Lautropia sp.]|nr:ribosome recycling factor [Lautropia sp.]